MGLLAFCWLIVELHVIPNGFLKWFYLSFYIHPFILLFCQIILWLKELQKWLLLLYFFPFRIAHLFIFGFLKRIIVVFLSSAASFTTTLTDNEVLYDTVEPEISTLQGSEIVLHGRRRNPRTVPYQVYASKFDSRVIFETRNNSKVHSVFEHGAFEAAEETDVNDDKCRSSWLYEYLYSDQYTCTLTTYYESENSNPSCSVAEPDTSPQTDNPQLHELKGPFVSLIGPENSPTSIIQEMIHDVIEDSEISFHDQSFDEKPLTDDTSIDDASIDHGYSPTFSCSDPPIGALKHQNTRRTVRDTPVNAFYQNYIERMGFYDFLYHERLYGMKAILYEHSTIPVLLMSNPSIDTSVSRKMLLRSLECDFELTYVAKICLSWEALHYQYWKIEALTLPDCTQFTSIDPNVSDVFQEFNILLEKFMEEQVSKGQRFSDSLHARISFQSLLQVPDITGYIMKGESNCMGGQAIITSCTSYVLEAIEKCIKTLFLYIKADNKRTLRKHNGIFRITYPSVEDPRELQLLYQVTKSLKKKKVLVADSQSKKKCWLRRRLKPPQQKNDLLFAMIDIQLVHRLLKMPVVSSSHLKWCQEKLNNLEIRQGHLFRASTSHLFPTS